MKIKPIDTVISQALKEDAAGNDVTTKMLVPRNLLAKAHILVKEEAVVCGLEIAQKIFRRLDKKIVFRFLARDGQKVKRNAQIAYLKGNARAILAGERTALNFLGHLSGIATLTQQFVQKGKPYRVKIFDTRKTTPGLRELEKYAVRCGGGFNHRSNLSEAVFVKDNHKALLPKNQLLHEPFYRIKKNTGKPIILEADNLKEFRQALNSGADVILLDNFSTSQIKKAVGLQKKGKGKKPLCEASGGITLNNIRHVAQIGVDRVSVGALTHSAKSIDISLEICKNK